MTSDRSTTHERDNGDQRQKQFGIGERGLGIDEACETVRLWAELFARGATGPVHPGDLVSAVAEVKRYLEDGSTYDRPIRELEIAEHLLATREGVRCVLPFVLAVESMQASDREPEIRSN